MWEWTQTVPGQGASDPLCWGFTDARGGVSKPPYGGEGTGGLNLGGQVGDDPAAVATNRARLASDLGLLPERLVFAAQVHGADVEVVTGPRDVAPEADAMVTTQGDLALAVLVADCVPVLLADVAAGVIGVAHAGRPGLSAGVVPAAVAAMRDLGGRDIRAAVGPSVCGRCYEVPAAMRAEVSSLAPVSATVSWAGTPALDVAAGVVDQLAGLGVPVEWRPGCTRESERLFSYRRAKTTGRFAGVVVRGTSCRDQA